MTAEYNRSILKLVVAQICQTIGYSSINSTPFEFLVDLMEEYMLRVARLTHQYTETLGRTESNLDDLGLAFQHMNIDINELADYIKNVDSVPCVLSVPKLPIHKENHLNFLKPGSNEVVTRPVNVHEHLPAMYPETEGDVKPMEISEEDNGVSTETPVSNGPTSILNNVSPNRSSPQVIFKRPGDPVSFESPMTKRARLMEEGRPLREIHSVMMTTSGFLSPAREGKLPEARTPQQTRADSPPSSSYPMVPPELKFEKKPKKIVKKSPDGRKLDKENKKKSRAKELFKVEKGTEGKSKKISKEGKVKSKIPKVANAMPGTSGYRAGFEAPLPKPPSKLTSNAKAPKTNQKIKTEKIIDLTVNSPNVEIKNETVDKLPSEPDKQKLNIFKKISKPREDKDKEMTVEQHKYGRENLHAKENSPGLMGEDHDRPYTMEQDKKEEKKSLHNSDAHANDDITEIPMEQPYAINNHSPPHIPSAPKTPELNMYMVPDQKKKRKEKISKKKESKKTAKEPSSKKIKQSVEVMESDLMDRPKTPQAPEPPQVREPVLPPTLPFPFLPTFTASPGLIPNPLFSRFPMPMGRGMPPLPLHNVPMPPRFMGAPIRPDDFTMNKVKNNDRDKHRMTPPFMDGTGSPLPKPDKAEKERPEKAIKAPKYEKERPITPPVPPSPVISPPVATVPVPAPLPSPPASAIVQEQPTPPVAAPVSLVKNVKADKVDKPEKKIKEHKKDKKDKLKKKKDKKDKHKDKNIKVKEKKDKSDKKEKIQKIKEKKEKKEKRKDKEGNKKVVKEEKAPEGVPKLTFKIGPPSPRPATPDNPLMKKITIKPVTKKPEEEVKREPSPELAKISALVTRPPKPKSTSKRAEEGIIDLNPAYASDNSFSTNLTSVSTASVSRTKKSIFKTLPPREPDPPVPQTINSLPEPPPPYYYDQSGRQIWICPACGRLDDGSPMIGCDDCDAWYHWVCVGMQVPPEENENWYCRICIAKKEEQHHDKKKKKRKKKMKVPA